MCQSQTEVSRDDRVEEASCEVDVRSLWRVSLWRVPFKVLDLSKLGAGGHSGIELCSPKEGVRGVDVDGSAWIWFF